MLILLILIIEIVLSIRSASLGLTTYLALRLCIPPTARFAGLSCNTLLLLIFIFFGLLSHLKILHNVPILFRKHLSYVILLFVPLFLLTFCSEYVPLEFQHKELCQFFFTEMLPFLFIPLVIRNKREYNTIIRVLLIASLINVSYGLFTFVSNSNPLINLLGANIEGIDSDLALSEEGRYGLKSKAVGIYSDKIFMALVSLLIFAFFYGKSLLNRKLLLSVLFLSFVTCFFTTQRTALFCILFFLFISMNKQKIFYKLRKYSVLLILMSTFIILSPPFKALRDFVYSTVYLFDDEKQAQIGNEGSSVSGRLAQLEGVAEIADNNLLHGLGYGFAKYREGTKLNLSQLYGLESFAFKIIVHSGIIGLLFWLLFFYKMAKSSILNNCVNNQRYGIAFNLSYFIAIMMTDTSGSFFLYLVFLELNCNRAILCSHNSKMAKKTISPIKKNNENSSYNLGT